MKPILSYVWQRRWCRLLVAMALLVALPMLHPFLRQSILGPKINGIPWCVWENAVRHAANPNRKQQSWLYQTLEKLHLRQGNVDLPDDAVSLWPIYVHLAEDADVEVRRHALKHLGWHGASRPEIVRSLRQHIKDADVRCRLSTAWGLWRMTKEEDVKVTVLPLVDHADNQIRREAVSLLSSMSRDMPALFDILSDLATDPDGHVRMSAIQSMPHFGRRGVPILRDAVRDSSLPVRHSAISAAGKLRKVGSELVPSLQVLQEDADPYIRLSAAHALHSIDPKRFAKPAQGLTDASPSR